MEIKKAAIKDIRKLIPALRQLRPYRTDEALEQQLPVLLDEGYQIIYIGDDSVAFALAGFRTLNMLHSGKTLYIDDLITHEDHRKKGYAMALLNRIKNYARENNYDVISLDSGFNRKDAHRLYLNFGLQIASLHFSGETQEL